MKYDYFVGIQSEQYSFLRIPTLLVTEPKYSRLSNESKVLFGLLLDRMDVAQKNDWIDEENRVYVIYPLEEIQSDLGTTKRKTMDCLAELESNGLIRKRLRGPGMPSMIYIKNLAVA